MQEDFIQFLWQFQKIHNLLKLHTSNGEEVVVIHPGFLNNGQGPDFLEARVKIANVLWVGSVELHLLSSSWYHHRHHEDAAYDNVILHVVWNNDIEISLPSGKVLPTLILSDYVDQEMLSRYETEFLKPSQFIPCEKNLHHFPKEKWPLWKERLFVERMETKVSVIDELLKKTKNNWEAVLFAMLCKNFGLNINGNAFLEMALQTPFKVVQQQCHDALSLEALLLGQSGLLIEETGDSYQKELWERYRYLKRKYELKPVTSKLSFARLRPHNFPTVRLAQLAALYANQPVLFQQLVEAETPEKIHPLFENTPSPYWKEHYNFGVKSKPTAKRISKSFFDLVTINTLIPIRFAYAKHLGLSDIDFIFKWLRTMKAEKNTITLAYAARGVVVETAMDSQSLLQLKKYYCDVKKCLSCRVGYHLMNSSA